MGPLESRNDLATVLRAKGVYLREDKEKANFQNRKRSRTNSHFTKLYSTTSHHKSRVLSHVKSVTCPVVLKVLNTFVVLLSVGMVSVRTHKILTILTQHKPPLVSNCAPAVK